MTTMRKRLLIFAIMLIVLAATFSLSAFALEPAEQGVITERAAAVIETVAVDEPILDPNSYAGDKIEGDLYDYHFNSVRSTMVLELREAMVNHKNEIYLYHETSEMLTEEYVLGMVLEAVEPLDGANYETAYQGDYLNYLVYDFEYAVEYFEANGIYYNVIVYVVEYTTTAEQEMEFYNAAALVLNELTPQAHNEYQKVKLIYDYILENVNYDAEHAADAEYLLQHSAYAALVEGKASSQGFAMLFYYMTQYMHLDSHIVVGLVDGVPFAWNMVKIYDKWYYVDIAVDAILGTSGSFFLKGSGDFADHDRDLFYETSDYLGNYPMADVAFDPTNVDGGTLDGGVTWKYDAELAAVVFSGNGPIPDVEINKPEHGMWYTEVPWKKYLENGVTYVIEEGITAVGDHVFYGNYIIDIQFPSTLTAIGEGAFANAAIDKIELPEGLTEIPKEAFRLAKLTSLVIPDSVTNIGESAFEESLLETVQMSNNLTVIGDNAFKRSHLKEIILPASLTEIGEDAFYMDFFTKYTVAEGNKVFSSYNGCLYNADQTVLINAPTALAEPFCFADTVTEIGEEAFYGCTWVSSIDIPDGVTKIGQRAFCSSSVRCVTLPDSLTKLEDGVFQYAGELDCVYIPIAVTEIGIDAFVDYRTFVIVYEGTQSQWDQVKLAGGPQSLYYATVIPEGNQLFSYNVGDFYAWTLDLDTGALEWKSDVAAQKLGDVITHPWAPWKDYVKTVSVAEEGWVSCIDSSTFADYKKLESITIGTTVTEIGDNAFAGCDNLTQVSYKGVENQWTQITIGAGNEALTKAEISFGICEAHNWDNGTVTKKPTMEEAGEKLLTCTVCGETKTEIISKLSDYNNPFTDVSAIDYFYAPVLWAVNNNITGGIGEGLFGPNNGCTRGQVVTFLWAANGKPEPESVTNSFTDVAESDYYYKAVLWAVENGITGGIGEGLFGPNETCTRGQIVTFLWASQGKPAVTASSEFTDVADTDWYAKPVIWAAEKGVTGGIGEGMFGPNNTCTRGQVVTFLYKVYG